MNRIGQMYPWSNPCVCPTRVGMNRKARFAVQGIRRLPHTRGDEPDGVQVKTAMSGVCPTRVGMNRATRRAAS